MWGSASPPEEDVKSDSGHSLDLETRREDPTEDGNSSLSWARMDLGKAFGGSSSEMLLPETYETVEGFAAMDRSKWKLAGLIPEVPT